MSLYRLFWLISVLLMLLFLTLTGRIVSSEWSAYQRSTKSIRAIKNVQLVLLAEEKLAAERGPTNTLLRQASGDAAKALTRLEQARLISDQSLTSLRQALQTQAAPQLTPVIAHVRSTEQALAAIRKKVDLLLAQPKSQRDPAAIETAVEQTMQTAGVFAPAIAALSDIAVQADPQFYSAMNSARMTSRLRHVAGKTASVFTAPVIAQRPLTAAEIYAFAKLSGQMDQLYSMIELQLQAYRDNQAFKNTLDAVRRHSLGSGLGFLNELLVIGGSSGDYGLSAAEMVSRYAPRLAAIPQLRDLILTEMLNHAEQSNRQATYFFLAVSSLAVVALGIFVLLMRVIRQRVLQAISMLEARNLDKAHLEEQREKMIAQLQSLSETDFLTGLLNRRALFSHGGMQFSIAQRYERQLTVILMDVDHFKAVNDRHGHRAGDTVLRLVADLCRRYHRKVDLLARYGGEEFLLLLPEIDLSQGLAVAEKLRSAIDACHCRLDDGHTVNITASFGVAAFDRDKSLECLIERADQALYQAKNGGRNRVVAAPQREFDESFVFA